LSQLSLLALMMEQYGNLMVRIFDRPGMYSVQLALLAQRWRRTNGAALESWLRALAELEALQSFATYSFEHPGDPFPELAEGSPCFEAVSLGHPLLAATKCVRNDVALGGDTRLLLVSGSNMSGKSTLLRSVGINAVLAMAGAPVRAARVRMTPLHVGASIQVNDSLQEGRSRFYSEILRLRAICELAEQRPPVLFLLDELLDGTNSSDRLTGATGIAHSLLASGAIGFISTHDLTLTELPGTGRALRNVHFEERIEDGEMHFDFKLRDGVVTTRNGVALMRMVGLKV
jgi:DNA mismatch repair ATPase MutS